MGAYVSGASAGKVTEKRPDFKTGVLLAARHEWVACVQLISKENILRVYSTKYGQLDVTIAEGLSADLSQERIILETAALLEENGFGLRIYHFKTPSSSVHDIILFLHSIDEVHWRDGLWDPKDDTTLQTASLTIKMIRGRFTVTLESEEPRELAVLASEITKRIYPQTEPGLQQSSTTTTTPHPPPAATHPTPAAASQPPSASAQAPVVLKGKS